MAARRDQTQFGDPKQVAALAIPKQIAMAAEGTGYGTTKVAFTPLSGSPLNLPPAAAKDAATGDTEFCRACFCAVDCGY